jgi:hypothetical protein
MKLENRDKTKVKKKGGKGRAIKKAKHKKWGKEIQTEIKMRKG